MRQLIVLAVLVFLVGLHDARADQLDRAEKQVVVNRVGKLLSERYIFPEKADLAKATIITALETGAYDGITNPSTFATRLTDDLRSVTHDLHMRVIVSAEYLAAMTRAPSAAQVPDKAGFAAVDRLKGNVGYIKLDAFPSLKSFRPVANIAISNIASTDALIIDLRENGGGEPESVAYLCSFFFNPKTPVHLNDLIARVPSTRTFSASNFWTHQVPISYLNKPIYLLTSSQTFSGGEEFANDLKIQKRARLIGKETTKPVARIPRAASNWMKKRFGIFIPWGRATRKIPLRRVIGRELGFRLTKPLKPIKRSKPLCWRLRKMATSDRH